MKSNATATWALPFDNNPLTKIWRKVTTSQLNLQDLIFEYLKLAEIAICLSKAWWRMSVVSPI
jgi:hypothetical protein